MATSRFWIFQLNKFYILLILALCKKLMLTLSKYIIVESANDFGLPKLFPPKWKKLFFFFFSCNLHWNFSASIQTGMKFALLWNIKKIKYFDECFNCFDHKIKVTGVQNHIWTPLTYKINSHFRQTKSKGTSLELVNFFIFYFFYQKTKGLGN